MAVVRRRKIEPNSQRGILNEGISQYLMYTSISQLHMDLEDDALYPHVFCCTVVLQRKNVCHYPPPAYNTVPENRIPPEEASSTETTPFSESGTTLVEPDIKGSAFRQLWLSLVKWKRRCFVWVSISSTRKCSIETITRGRFHCGQNLIHEF